jgi:hypothetical protein
MGQVAIYDAVNPTSMGRKQLAKEFMKHDIQVCGLCDITSTIPLFHISILTNSCFQDNLY